MTVSSHWFRVRFVLLSLASLVLAACGSGGSPGSAPAAYASQFIQVNLDPSAPASFQLAVQACAGLNNGRLGGSVYIQTGSDGPAWLNELQLTPAQVVDASAFLSSCRADFPACVRYSYHDQQALLPNILTVAAVLAAVPVDVDQGGSCSSVAFDATVEFKSLNTPEDATRYVYEHYLQQTTGLAMLDPGYDQTSPNHSHPPITHDMSPALVDYVFARKLFVVFLNEGCVPLSSESALLSEIVNSGQWPTPIEVYGYNDAWLLFGGDFFEAETLCLPSRNMGQIASMTNNLSFFSMRRPALSKPAELTGNPPHIVQYDPTRTYVAFVVGDGDNIQYLLNARHDWFMQRLSSCAGTNAPCAPLTWTLSPHLPALAPDVMQWYYQAARQTGRDYFTLPPSGHLYAYPASLDAADQANFVRQTQEDAALLGVHGTVDWEWFTTWRNAEQDFVPLYATPDSSIQGVFTVNVPYLLPNFWWWPESQFYEVLDGQGGGKVVLFRPREWRGVDGHDPQFYPTPQDLSRQLAAYPAGTVTWVYMTSDGGLSLQNSFMELEKILPANVQLVSADDAARLALQASSH